MGLTDMPTHQRVLVIEEALASAMEKAGLEVCRAADTAEWEVWAPAHGGEGVWVSLYAVAAELESQL